jgi:hypothetical protein
MDRSNNGGYRHDDEPRNKPIVLPPANAPVPERFSEQMRARIVGIASDVGAEDRAAPSYFLEQIGKFHGNLSSEMIELNAKLYEGVFKTDPRYVRDIPSGDKGRKAKTITSAHLVRHCTEMWGPIGLFWLPHVNSERTIPGHILGDPQTNPHMQRQQTIIISMTVFFPHRFEKDGPIYMGAATQYGDAILVGLNKFGIFTDSTAFKKAHTAALSKCLSLVGFGADVFLGLYDNKKWEEHCRDIHGSSMHNDFSVGLTVEPQDDHDNEYVEQNNFQNNGNHGHQQNGGWNNGGDNGRSARRDQVGGYNNGGGNNSGGNNGGGNNGGGNGNQGNSRPNNGGSHQNGGHHNNGHHNNGHHNNGHQNNGHQNNGHQNNGHQNNGHQNNGHQGNGNGGYHPQQQDDLRAAREARGNGNHQPSNGDQPRGPYSPGVTQNR